MTARLFRLRLALRTTAGVEPVSKGCELQGQDPKLEACQRGWSPWGWSESAFSEENLLVLAHLPKNEFNYAHMHFQKNVALGLGLRVGSFSFQLFWCPKPY